MGAGITGVVGSGWASSDGDVNINDKEIADIASVLNEKVI